MQDAITFILPPNYLLKISENSNNFGFEKSRTYSNNEIDEILFKEKESSSEKGQVDKDMPRTPFIFPNGRKIMDELGINLNDKTTLGVIEKAQSLDEDLKLTIEETKALYAFAMSPCNKEIIQAGCFGLNNLSIQVFILITNLQVGTTYKYQIVGRNQENYIEITTIVTIEEAKRTQLQYVAHYIMKPTKAKDGFCLVLQNNYEAQMTLSFWLKCIDGVIKKLSSTDFDFAEKTDVVALIPFLRNPTFAQAFCEKIQSSSITRSQAQFIIACIHTCFPKSYLSSLLGISMGLVISVLILLPLLLVIGHQALIAMAGSAILFGVAVALVVLIPSLIGGLIGNRLDRTANLIREFDHFLSQNIREEENKSPVSPPVLDSDDANTNNSPVLHPLPKPSGASSDDESTLTNTATSENSGEKENQFTK